MGVNQKGVRKNEISITNNGIGRGQHKGVQTAKEP